MKKFEGILICTDLDGTLLREDKSISKKNLEAIEYFKGEGGFFTIISGRAPQTAIGICKEIDANAPFGCMNGGGIYDWREEKYVWVETLPRDVCELLEMVNREEPEVAAQVNAIGALYFHNYNPAMLRFREINKLPDVRKRCCDVTEPITKILFADDSEERLDRLAKLLANHPKAHLFSFIRSEIDKYEILPKGISKGTALLKIAELVGAKKTIAVGDYDNDIEMIKSANIGIAVENASENAKAVADYITVSNEEDAIAKIIEDMERGIIL